MERKLPLPSMFQVFLVLGTFLLLAFSFTAEFNLPIQLALCVGWFLAMGLGLKLGHKYKDLEAAAGEGIYKGMGAILILLAVGALVGTWIAGGIVPSIIYFGLQTIHPSIFLLATLIICSMTALATGTSWGAAGTAGIAMMGIGQGLGVPMPVTAGAILSGVYFGDKLSPLSDSVILASSMSEVEIVDHIKGMLPISLTAYILTAIAFTAYGLQFGGNADMAQVEAVMQVMDSNFNISLMAFIPVIAVLLMLSKKLPSYPVIMFGSALGIVWAVLFQDRAPVEAISSIWAPLSMESGNAFIDNILNRGGMSNMLGSVAVIIFGLGFGGLLDKVGILETVAKQYENKITNEGNLTVYTVLTAFFANVFGSAMYVSLILTPKIMSGSYDRMNVDRRMLSRSAEFGGTLTSGMVPWSDNGIFMAGLLGVSTVAYVPYMWMSFISIGLVIAFAYLGKFRPVDQRYVKSSDKSLYQAEMASA
ncbi:Na+/H+ antiporter NhaC [Endozoicomonas sp. OPT23]|uniref:Na+/H+ antiporter NhaC n=1 Tax=Endozoicomonas sp. OPT23 TaxID=2072845 RepID=UPI00129A41DA|nr:Na+/H+ antiporter NhaC [Endozoicomonas sp. OPT23]MRI34498.1 Na+/H+ antiporter NhaC [Endozoicomonas sp. OPT23]